MANRLNIPPPTRVAIGFATVNGKQVPLFIDPEWAKYFESLNTQVNTTSAAVGLPGAAGATGAAGAAVSLGGSDDGGSVEFIPGPPGQPGADGGAGPALMLSISEESAPEFVPGPQGIQGPAGNDGATVGFLSFEEAGIEFIPGPPGATGAAGPAGAVIALMLGETEATEMPGARPVNGGVPLTDGDPVTGTGSLVRATSPTIAAPTVSGTATMQGLIDASGASAGQISFPATQNASAGANTLDDYEEGTWTPVMTFATPGTLAVTYAARVGTYTKIGNQVTVNCTIVINAGGFVKGTASGQLSLTGLPFALNGSMVLVMYQDLSAVAGDLAASTLVLAKLNASGTSLAFEKTGVSGANVVRSFATLDASAFTTPNANVLSFNFSLAYMV